MTANADNVERYAKITETWKRVLRGHMLEPGRDHPGTEWLASAFKNHAEQAWSWIVWVIDHEAAKVVADTLECLSYVRDAGQLGKGREVAYIAGLRSHHVIVRDAILQVIEYWDDVIALPLLFWHVEPVEWLREYRVQVIADLIAEREQRSSTARQPHYFN